MSPRERAFDWAAARAQLARAAAALESDESQSPERAKALMDARARALAVPEAPQPSAAALELLVFSLAGALYAVELRYVREVTRLVELSPVPGLPSWFSGVTSVRGEILALIDLRGFLGVAGAGLSDSSRAVVLGRERGEFAILADELARIVSLSPGELIEAPAALQGGGADALGLTRDAVLVLDGQAMLEDPRLSAGRK